MAKIKYKFNPITLNYEQVQNNAGFKVRKVAGYLLTSTLFGLLFFFVLSSFYETPGMKAVKRENRRLLTQYELMNRDMDRFGTVLEDIQHRDDNIYRVIFEAEPIPKTLRESGFGGVNRYKNLESMDNAEMVVSTARKLDILLKEAYIQSKSFDEVTGLVLNKEKMLASIPAVMPISNRDLKRTASGFGMRMHPVYKIRKFHYGMDFTAPTGTEIYATGDGKVKEVKSSRTGYGKHIVVDHNFGYETLYGHMNAFNVRKGQKVKRGDLIGYVGSTGTSTAPHLHYEVHRNGKAVNPQYYYFKDLTPQEYEQMIYISSNMGQTFD